MAKKEKLQLTEEQWNFINKKKLKNRNYADSLLSLWYRIEFYMKRYGFCDKTNKYFEKRLGLKPSSVKRYIDDLIKLGLVMRVRMGASERKLFAIRPKIEEKLTEDFGNKNASKTSFEPHNEPHIEPLYNKDIKSSNLNLSKVCIKETKNELSEMDIEILKCEYEEDIVMKSLHIFENAKNQKEIFNPLNYLKGICKKLLRNQKALARRIAKKEKLEREQQRKFEEMAQNRTEQPLYQPIPDDYYYDWMNDEEDIEQPKTLKEQLLDIPKHKTLIESIENFFSCKLTDNECSLLDFENISMGLILKIAKNVDITNKLGYLINCSKNF
nr:MAG TPA: dissimilatory sulfite reductase D [Caudoviricetes sp.]